MRKLWKRYVHQLDLDLNTKIFDNVKNLLVCALLFAAGTNVLRSQHEVFMGLAGATISGWVLIGISGLLMLLNISDGLNRLARLPHHRAVQVIFCVVYLILAFRMVEIVWDFRAE